LTERLADGARVLDVGCGPGEQAAWLSERFHVVGFDISQSQLRLGRRRAPDADFILGDMCALPFKAGSFGAIAAIYSIIHVAREQHAALFAALRELLKPGGRLFAVLGANNWQGSEENWLDLGAEMRWSHYDADTNLALLKQAGFSPLDAQIEADELTGEGEHLFVVAERR
jgi:ubiquinone/menaquinone biosynthesis C-methylase UbiE